MIIGIKKYLEGAREAEGFAVIIDVFRASNTIIACFARGAEYIIPVAGIEEAHDFKKAHSDYLLFGERNGVAPKGFDYNNSPGNILKLNLHNKKIILTTSAGTQGIVNAQKADRVLIASFANIDTIANYIKSQNPQKVSLVALGENAAISAEEDEECAKYLEALLLGQLLDFNAIKSKLLNSDGAKRLRGLEQDDDLEFALELNKYDIIPEYDRKNNKIINIRQLLYELRPLASF